jgi:hypothetical protein
MIFKNIIILFTNLINNNKQINPLSCPIINENFEIEILFKITNALPCFH